MSESLEEISDVLYEELVEVKNSQWYGIPDDSRIIMSLQWTGSSKRLAPFTHQQVLDAAHSLIKQGLVIRKNDNIVGNLFRVSTPKEIVQWKKNQLKH